MCGNCDRKVSFPHDVLYILGLVGRILSDWASYLVCRNGKDIFVGREVATVFRTTFIAPIIVVVTTEPIEPNQGRTTEAFKVEFTAPFIANVI